MPLSKQQTGDIQKQFDPMRRRLQQQESANLEGQRDALARNAARLGGGPSGAMIKQEQLAMDASARRLADANDAVDAQQAAVLNQAREAQAGRDFAREERLGSQKFASGESALQRKFQTGERIGTQQFQTGERMGAQQFQTGERQAGEVFSASQLKSQLDAQKQAQIRQINHEVTQGHLNREQADKQLAATVRQFDMEFKQNVISNYMNNFYQAMSAGVDPVKANAMLQDLVGLGVSIDENGNVTMSPTYIEGYTGRSANAGQPQTAEEYFNS